MLQIFFKFIKYTVVTIINFILNLLFTLSAPIVGIEGSGELSIETIYIQNNVKINIYIPKIGLVKSLIIYYHGGGWFFGSLKAFDSVLRYLSNKSNCIVVGVEYRKTPKYKFPTQINDSINAYKWVVQNIDKYNISKNNIILAGDSAGANLALVVNKNIQKLKLIKPKALILFYPLLDISKDAIKKIRMESNKFINILGYYVLKYIIFNYLVDDKQSSSSSISINKHLDKYKLPRTFIIQASMDPLNIQIEEFSAHMLKNKQSLICKKYDKTIHGFLNLGRLMKNSYKALNDAAKFASKI